jgi:hypothetical protein
MKLYTRQRPAYNGDNGWNGDGRYNAILADLPNYLYMGSQGSMIAHDKTTLSPLFGKTLSIFGGPKGFLLTNHVQGSTFSSYWTDNTRDKILGPGGDRRMHPVNAEHTYTSVLLGGASLAAGVPAKKIWQSSRNSDEVFWTAGYDGYDSARWSQSWHYTHRYTYYYKYNLANDSLDRQHEFNCNHQDTYWYHEDDTYLYGMAKSVYPYYWYHRHFRMRKSDMSKHHWGHSNRSHEYHLLYKHPTAEYILVFTNNYINNSTSTHYAGINKIDLNSVGVVGDSTTSWHYMTQRGNISSGNPSKSFLSVASDSSDDYNHHFGYHGHLYSDGTVISGKSNFHCYNNPALVANSTLINNGSGLIRTYYARFDRNDDLVIDRINTPLDSNPNTNTASHNKKCVITQGSGTTKLTFTNYVGASGTAWGGSSTHAYQGIKLQWFETGTSTKKGYLIFSGAYEAASDSAKAHALHVFKITNYNASISTGNKGETDSIALEHIQTMDLGDHILCHFAPANDYTKHICLLRGNQQHPFLKWNESTEQFEISHYINQNIVKIATLDSGEVVSHHMDGGAGSSLHMESLTLPNKVEVVLSEDKYTFTGSPVSASADVSVKNFENALIAKTVNLTLIGDGVEFTSGGKTKTITTSSSAATTVNFTISKSTVVRIKATVSA